MTVLRKLEPQNSSALPLRVDYVIDSHATPPAKIYCSDIEGTNVRVSIQEPSAVDTPWETGEWYRFDGVTPSKSLGAELVFRAGEGKAERIDTPERQEYPSVVEPETPWLIQLGTSDEVIALTVQPRPMSSNGNISVENPETYEISAVCFAYCDGSGDTTVYHREEPTTEDEHLLLEHVVDDLSEATRATLVTRGGNHVPLEMLYQRLRLASEGDIVGSGAEQVLEECFHASPESIAARAEVNTLAEIAQQRGIDNAQLQVSDYDIGIDPVDWRGNWEGEEMSLTDASDPQMTERDYATLVERYLGPKSESVDSAQLSRCLKDYASTELSLLRELVTHGSVDQLGCQRISGRLLTEE